MPFTIPNLTSKAAFAWSNLSDTEPDWLFLNSSSKNPSACSGTP